jgi:hypothetical protein
MAAPNVLYDLLMALFTSEPELRRFLGLAGLTSVEQRLPHEKGTSLRSTAAETSALLQDLGLVQEELFTALARRAPERADDVWDVARELGVEHDTAPDDYPDASGGLGTASGDEPPPRAAKAIAVPKAS